MHLRKPQSQKTSQRELTNDSKGHALISIPHRAEGLSIESNGGEGGIRTPGTG